MRRAQPRRPTIGRPGRHLRPCKTRLDTSGEPQDVDGVALSATVRSAPVPVLVDLWAPWCGPCRTAAPIIDAIARKHAGRLLVLKLNSDEQPETSARHGVQGIPTFVLFRNGLEIARQVGLPGREALQRWVLQEVGAEGQPTCPIPGNSKSPRVRRY